MSYGFWIQNLRVLDKALPVGYVNNAYYNGLGRHVCQLQRLTLKFCKSRLNSMGVRQFIESDLVDFARKNPGTAIYLKPRRHRSPVLVAEYLNGERHWMSLYRFTKEEVVLWLDFMRTRSGPKLHQFLTESYTPKISVQGTWNPFLNKPSHLNVSSFPNFERSKHIPEVPSATEQLIEIAKANSNIFVDKI